jgi:hypothetical protein
MKKIVRRKLGKGEILVVMGSIYMKISSDNLAGDLKKL